MQASSAYGTDYFCMAPVVGVLHAMLVCAETRPAICRIMAGWNQQPLVAALTTQQVSNLLRELFTAKSAADHTKHTAAAAGHIPHTTAAATTLS